MEKGLNAEVVCIIMVKEISAQRKTFQGDVPLKLKNLERINILFGKNGSGKSSFVRNLYQNDPNTFHLVVPERGGDILHNSGVAENEYKLENRKKVRNKNNDNQYRERAISRMVNILTSEGHKTVHDKESGRVKISEITDLFQVVLPEFSVKFSEEPPFKFEVYRESDDNLKKVENVNQLSSGEAETLALATDIITESILSENKILLIDEPDVHLHLDMQHRFAIFLSEIMQKYNVQIIVTTHSPALIASILSVKKDVGIFCLDSKNKNIAAVKKDQNSIFTNLLNVDLGLAVILGRKVIIVEGNDDFLIWNQASRNPNFADCVLIQANGQDVNQYRTHAESILTSVLDINEKVGLTILDGDNRGNPSSTQQVGGILPCARLQCCTIENLLFTNEILAYVNSEVNLNEILNELSGDCCQSEKEMLEKIKYDKRCTKIDKKLTQKIYAKLDKHSSLRDWRVMLGKFLGNNQPVGELKEYLGNEIVNYIWN